MLERLEGYQEVAAALNFMLERGAGTNSQFRHAIDILANHGIHPISLTEARHLLETTTPRYLDRWILFPVPDGPAKVDRLMLIDRAVRLVKRDGRISPSERASLCSLSSQIGLSVDDLKMVTDSFEQAKSRQATRTVATASSESERESYLSYLRMLCAIFKKLLDEYSFDSEERWYVAQYLSAGDDSEVDAATVLWLLNNLTDEQFPPKVWLQSVPEDTRSAFLHLAVDIALTDGEVTRREFIILTELAERLLLPRSFAARVLEHKVALEPKYHSVDLSHLQF